MVVKLSCPAASKGLFRPYIHIAETEENIGDRFAIPGKLPQQQIPNSIAACLPVLGFQQGEQSLDRNISGDKAPHWPFKLPGGFIFLVVIEPAPKAAAQNEHHEDQVQRQHARGQPERDFEDMFYMHSSLDSHRWG